MYKKTILIDLDGVLNEYSGVYEENNIPNIKLGAKDFLKKLNADYNLILFTSRNLLQSAKWLIKNKIDKYFIDITNIKKPSFLLIDDRTLCFKNDYSEIIDEIKNFKPYWK